MGFISKWLKERELNEATVQYELNQINMANKLLEEARSTPIRDTDEAEWIQSGADERMGQDEHSTMLNNAYTLYHTNTHARAIIRTLVKFTLGKGQTIIPEDDNQKVKDVWKDFVKENKFNLREKEIASRLFRDGEVFQRLFKSKSVKKGAVKIRFIRASSIAQPTKYTNKPETSFGIKTDSNDIETPIEYYKCSNDGILQDTIPAKDIIHLKILSDSDQKRGISVLRIAAKRLKQYDDWMEDRIVLNKVRSAIALIKKISGPSSKVKKIREEGLSDRLSESRKKIKAFHRGTVITTSDNVEYSMLSPKIGAQDVKDDGRSMLLSVASAVGFPEMVLTADYSNANFASSQIAQNPFIREIEDWQDYFTTFYKELFEIVIQNAIDYGELKKGTSTDCTVEFPPIVLAELLDLAKAYEILHKYKVLSKKTWASRMGFDFDLESAYQEEEEEDDMPPGMPPGTVPPGQPLPGVKPAGQPGTGSPFNMPTAPVNQFGAMMEAIALRNWEVAREINNIYFKDEKIATLIDTLEQREYEVNERETFSEIINNTLEEMGKVHQKIIESNYKNAKEMTTAIVESLSNIKFETIVNTPDVKAGNVVINQEPTQVTVEKTEVHVEPAKVEVKPPDVSVEVKPTEVNVDPKIVVQAAQAPEVTVVNEQPIAITTPEPKVNVENIVNIPAKKKSKKTVERDKEGNVISITEEFQE